MRMKQYNPPNTIFSEEKKGSSSFRIETVDASGVYRATPTGSALGHFKVSFFFLMTLKEYQ
jgi:hypothetical protein